MKNSLARVVPPFLCARSTYPPHIYSGFFFQRQLFSTVPRKNSNDKPAFNKIEYPDYSVGPPCPLQLDDLGLSTTTPTSTNVSNGILGRGLAKPFTGWWEYYVRGENPDYPMRKRMFEYLWNRGVDVYKMSYVQLDDWTRWVEIRRQCAITHPSNPKRYPQFPRSVTLEDKLKNLQRVKPRRDSAWRLHRKHATTKNAHTVANNGSPA